MSAIASNKTRSRTAIRADALLRLMLLHSVAGFNRSILVTEFPKSGGTWLSAMVADLSGLPFPQNRMPGLSSAIFHGHYLHSGSKVRKLVLWRDPRDMVVSWYFHCLVSEHTNPSIISRTRADLPFDDYTDVSDNLSAFIEYMFTRQDSPKFTWNEFFDAWADKQGPEVTHTTYERLSANTVEELRRICDSMGIEPELSIDTVASTHSFEAVSGRRRGQSDASSFLRKGVVGDWKQSFTAESLDTLMKFTEGRLNRYEDFVSTLGFGD